MLFTLPYKHCSDTIVSYKATSGIAYRYPTSLRLVFKYCQLLVFINKNFTYRNFTNSYAAECHRKCRFTSFDLRNLYLQDSDRFSKRGKTLCDTFSDVMRLQLIDIGNIRTCTYDSYTSFLKQFRNRLFGNYHIRQ